MIDLRGLSVRYGDTLALRGVTLRIGGGAVGLLGPNGAGKSTLIKTLLGQIHPSDGGGTVLGLDIRRRFLDIRQRVGYLPERDCNVPGMTGVAFVAYAGRLAGMSRGDARQRAHEVLNYVGLEEERYRKVDSFSSGMLQRVKLAQALVHDPALLFLDEPTNGMDPRGRTEMLDLVRDISANKGVHVLVSSHLLPDVESVCGEVVVLARGRVLAQGNIEEMRQGAGSAFVVRVRGDRAGFVRALREGGSRVSDGARGDLRVVLEDGATEPIWRAAVKAGVQVRHLDPSRRSLEDVFLEALETDTESGGED